MDGLASVFGYGKAEPRVVRRGKLQAERGRGEGREEGEHGRHDSIRKEASRVGCETKHPRSLSFGSELRSALVRGENSNEPSLQMTRRDRVPDDAASSETSAYISSPGGGSGLSSTRASVLERLVLSSLRVAIVGHCFRRR